MAQPDYYSLLGIDRHAPDREVKRAYYAIARDLHPDKARGPQEARENAEKLAVISKAYNTLKDPEKRKEYDATLGFSRRAASPPAGGGGAAASSPPSASTASGGGGQPAARPAAPSPAPGAGPKMSANDIASQRVLTAQKAFVKGMEFFRTADYKKALPFLETAVQNDPDGEPQYHMRLAQTLMKTKGSFSRAVTAAEKASQMDAYNMEFKLGLAEIYETVGIPSKAMVVYEEVLKWDADNQKAKMRLQMMKQEEKARNPNLLAKVFPSLFGKK